MGLSPAIQLRLVQAVKEINRKTGITLLITEQYAQPIFPIVDYGYVMEKGTVVLAGTAKELTDNPHVKAAYLGLDHGSHLGRKQELIWRDRRYLREIS